jgi:hypothetical protein
MNASSQIIALGESYRAEIRYDLRAGFESNLRTVGEALNLTRAKNITGKYNDDEAFQLGKRWAYDWATFILGIPQLDSSALILEIFSYGRENAKKDVAKYEEQLKAYRAPEIKKGVSMNLAEARGREFALGFIEMRATRLLR